MYPALISTIVSTGVLLVLLVLFRVETGRGSRFLERARRGLDVAASFLARTLDRTSSLFGRETIRQSVHYLFHQLLKGLKFVTSSLERGIDALLRTNKALARKASKQPVRTKLTDIADHKASTTLSDKEKRERKEKSVGTRL